MKKKIIALLLILTIVCSLFAFVACNDPNETPSEEIPGDNGGGEQNTPSGEVPDGDNNQDSDNNNQDNDNNDQDGNDDKPEGLIPAYMNYKGEEIDYSQYFKTNGNGRITGLSDYAIEKREEIFQLEIPEKIGNEDITALSVSFYDLPYLRVLIIPDSIKTIDDTINFWNTFPFQVIYCEASSKPQGWDEEWDSEKNLYDDSVNVIAATVVWGYKENEVADDGKVYCFSSSGMLYALKDSQAELVFSGKSDVKNLELESEVKYKNKNYSVVSIYPLAFASADYREFSGACSNYKNLKSLKLPNSLMSIGVGALSFCNSITSIEIPSSVTSIGEMAFYDCISLRSLEIPGNVTKIGNEAFSWCSSLTSIEIPSSVTSIGDSAFSDCSCLTIYCEAESAPSGWQSDWNSDRPVVWNCKNNEVANDGNIYYVAENGIRFALKDGEATVVEQSLNGEIVIQSKVINKDNEYKVTNISENAFSYCRSLISIEIPSSVTNIDSYAFQNCSSLTSITVDKNNLKYASQGGILYNKEKTDIIYVPQAISGTVVIPSSVMSIGSYAFNHCDSLTSIKFEDNSQLTMIGYDAFRGCSSLENIEIPSSVERVEPGAFEYCNELTNVYITDMTSWCSISFGDSTSNPLYYASKLYLNNELVTELKIPDGVEIIDQYAFYGYSGLESVVISSNVRSIAAKAFYRCDNLTSVTFENTSWGYTLSTGQIVEPDDMDVTNPTANANNLKSGKYVYYSKHSGVVQQ